MQLASKMRFISAQFEAYLDGGIWRKNAQHANNMAKLLFDKTSRIHGIEITQPVEANAVFAIIPANKIKPLQDRYFFYVWDETRSEVRWMTSFDTTTEDIDNFAAALSETVS